jgi:Ca2+-transporting ATPase
VWKKLYHQKEVEEVFREFNSGPEGLSGAEALKLLEKYGPNTLEQGERLNILKIFIRQFADPLIYILLIAAVFTAYIQQSGRASRACPGISP